MISVLGKDVFSTVEEIVDPGHTALVMIDIQHDFCSPKGLFDRIGKNLQMMAPAVERVAKLIAKARSAGVLPIFIQNQWLPQNRIVSASFLRFMIYKQGMDPKDFSRGRRRLASLRAPSAGSTAGSGAMTHSAARRRCPLIRGHRLNPSRNRAGSRSRRADQFATCSHCCVVMPILPAPAPVGPVSRPGSSSSSSIVTG